MKKYVEAALLAISPAIIAFDLALAIAGHHVDVHYPSHH